MHATVDRQICEHDVGHVFVSPHSSRQRGVHTSRVCRVYLSLRSRPHFVSCQEVSCRILRSPIFFYGHIVIWHRVVPAQDQFKRKWAL